jgi:thioredoxin reductase (NADPH)
VAPFELMENFRKSAVKFGAQFVTDAAKAIRRDPDGKTWIVACGKAEYPARAVLVASGAQYRRLGLKNEGRLIGRGVSYFATCDGAFFRDADIAMVGGGDTALMEAVFLTKFASKVHLIHRRDQLRGTKILQERVFDNPKIQLHWSTVVEEILGAENVEGIVLRRVTDGARETLPLKGVFVSIGMDPTNDVVQGLLPLNERGEIVVDRRMRTCEKGLFAAGDVIDSTPHQVATAVGTGVHAAISIGDYLAEY